MSERDFQVGDFVDVAGIGENSSGRIVAVHDNYYLILIQGLGVVKTFKPFITLKLRVEEHLVALIEETEKNAM